MVDPTTQHSALNTHHSAQNAKHSALSTQHSIYVAGHRGMVGSAIIRRLREKGYTNIITRTHQELDLVDQAAVRDFFQNEKIDHVVLAAARVGGIHANNTYPADFIYQNLMIETNVIHKAYKAGVERLLFLGSSCIYPRNAPQPMKEEYLLDGHLEPTNEPYAIAKIAGIKLCESYNRQYGNDYRSVMPTNLYGPGDNYDLENSHVIPALIRKFHLAKLAMQGDLEGIQQDERTHGSIPGDIKDAIGLTPDSSQLTPHSATAQVVIWGSGLPRREFLHVNDLADACVFIMELDNETYGKNTDPMLSHINVGTGVDVTIKELASMIKDVVGFTGEVAFNSDKPDGTLRKLLDVSKINNMDWRANIGLREGLQDVYNRYVESICD